MNVHQTPISLDVAAVYESYPEAVRDKLLVLRQLILETAATFDGVGDVEETLKWGEPSYLTSQTKSGSTIRLAPVQSSEDRYAIYFNCTANLVPAFREKYPTLFTYGGDRSIEFAIDDEVPVSELQQCVALALTYHRNKKLEASARWDMVDKHI